MAVVHLPSQLASRAGAAEVPLAASSVREALSALVDAHPPLDGWVTDEKGGLRQHVSVFVNDRQADLDTPLGDDDRLYVVPAISGGAGNDGETRLLVGTRKGLFVLAGPRGGELAIAERWFEGQNADFATVDRRTGVELAGVSHGQYGPRLMRREPGGEWEQTDLAFPEDAGDVLERVWSVEPGELPGQLWAGVSPAALFESRDDGRTWKLNRALWTVPGREEWNGGAGGLCLHSICPRPGRPERLAVGVSAAGVSHGQYGPRLMRREPGGEWRQTDLAFPEDAGDVLERVWSVEPGELPGQLWAGVSPAALFESRDDGLTWTLNRALWTVPGREEWDGGAGGLCLHSICPWPGRPERLAVGVSAAGVWRTKDGGESWAWGVDGLVPRYVPEEARAETTMYCIHHMERCPERPERLYLQFHGGVYRSDDEGASWVDLHTDSGLPADFGFPLLTDPRDPERAYVIPLVADVDRVTPDGKLRVYTTGNAGVEWQPLAGGLPQQGAWLTVLRQAFAHDGGAPLGLFFGATSGEVFASADGGESWVTAARRLPPVLSVRCA